jgi:hypothetical protein
MIEFALGFIAGVAAFAAYQTYRQMKSGKTMVEAAKAVIAGGGGPGSRG